MGGEDRAWLAGAGPGYVEDLGAVLKPASMWERLVRGV